MKFFNLHSRKESSDTGTNESHQKTEAVLYSERLYEQYKSARTGWEKNIKEDSDFAAGNQWTEEAKVALVAAKQAPIVINIIQPSIEQMIAALTSNSPRFTATAKEDSDVKTAKVIADLLEYIWYISDGNMHLKQAIKDYSIKGLGALGVYFDPNADAGKGEVKITSISPYDLWIDPNSKDPYGRDAAHIIVSTVKTYEQIQADYPFFPQNLYKFIESTADMNNEPSGSRADILGTSFSTFGNDLSHQRARVIDRYSKIKKMKYGIVLFDGNEELDLGEDEFQEFISTRLACVISGKESSPQIFTQQGKVQFYLQLAEQGEGYFHLAIDPESQAPVEIPGVETLGAIPGSTMKVAPITILEAIQEGAGEIRQYTADNILRVLSIGGVEAYSGELDYPHYPIVLMPNRHDRNPYPMGDVRMVRDLQEQVNKIESLIQAHASNSTNVKWWVPRGGMDKTVLEKELNKAGTAVLEYDPEIGAPISAQPPPLPAELYKNKADKIAEIERIIGIYALMDGSPENAPATYKGTVALDEYGQRRIRSKKDDIEGALNILAKVVICFIQKYYTSYKVARLVQPNNLPTKQIVANQPLYTDYGEYIGKANDISAGKYDVVVVSGSMLPSNRYAMAEYYKELAQIGLIDQQEFLMKTEVADVEGVLERTSIISQQDKQIASLMEEIKMLKGDMQTLQRENVHLSKRVEVEKFKGELAEPKQAVKKSAQLYEERNRDLYKLQKDEFGLIKKENQIKRQKGKSK